MPRSTGWPDGDICRVSGGPAAFDRLALPWSGESSNSEGASNPCDYSDESAESGGASAGSSEAVEPDSVGAAGGPAPQVSDNPGRKRSPPPLWSSERERSAVKRRGARRVKGQVPTDQQRKTAGREAQKATAKGRASKKDTAKQTGAGCYLSKRTPCS